MTTEAEQKPAWFIDEGMPGTGNRPDWLPEKFKSVADLGKSYHELEKKVGTPPDEYSFNSKYLDPDYVPFQELKQLAKEKRVSQDVMDKMISSFDKYMDEFRVDTNEEVKKLGNNAQERITTLDNWAKANLSKEAYDALSQSLRSAESFKALEELRGKFMSNTTQIPGNSGNVSANPSVKDLQLELSNNYAKYKSDENYRKDLQRRLEVAVKNDPSHIDKVGS